MYPDYLIRNIEKVYFPKHQMGDLNLNKSDKNSVNYALTGFVGLFDDVRIPPTGAELRNNKNHFFFQSINEMGKIDGI